MDEGTLAPTAEAAHGSQPSARGLRRGALGLPSLLAQSIGHITPLLGIFVGFQFIASFAGLATPMCFFIGMSVLAMIAASAGQLAKYFPSSGGFITYITGTVGKKAGLFIAWVFVLFDPIQAALVYPFMGYISEQFLKAQYSIYVPWWVFVIIATLFTGATSYRGIKISARTLIITSAIEIVVVLALATFGVFDPGKGGFSLAPFNPGNAPSFSGFGFGILFSVSVYAGWESAAPLAVEGDRPRQLIPIAMVASILLIGIIDTYATWGYQLGWGVDRIPSLVSSGVNPLLVLGRHFWGAGVIIVMVGFWNSCLAGGQAFFNTATRMEYGLGEVGAIPRVFARLHPQYRTPVVAVAFQIFLTLALGLGMGFWPAMGPDEFIFFGSYLLSLALFLIYGAAMVGVMKYFLTERRSEFNLILHAIFPIVSTGILAWATYKSVLPAPTTAPLKYAPYVFLAWFVLGLLLVWGVRLAGKEDWLNRASAAAIAATQGVK